MTERDTVAVAPATQRDTVAGTPAELDGAAWRAAADAHRARVSRWTEPHRERRRRGEPHPVLDFLFTYYSLRPAQLERWDPGPGVVLRDAQPLRDRAGYRETADGGIVLDAAALPRLGAAAGYVGALLAATARRPARLGCLGLHEWAMVYGSDAPRHGGVPLRLGSAGTDAVVESMQVSCTHYDAFRFFTDAARPRNALSPTRATQVAMEQPGCLHATMDLYKWAYKIAPACPSELLADCFELAVEVRELDMAASPYDLADRGYPPVRIETPAGRAEYVRHQAGFAERAAPLRRRLIALCDTLTGGPPATTAYCSR